MAVFAGGKLFTGNDSGPAHIAAVKTPLVVMFGPAVLSAGDLGARRRN